MDTWQKIDEGPPEQAQALLRTACASTRWVERMMSLRPFGSRDALLGAAQREWFDLSGQDWLEAFLAHPRIGERASLRERFPDTHHLSAREQSQVAGASDDLLAALEEANRQYFDRFGYIFIVCATGKSAEEMLALVRERLHNDPEVEIRVAAEEQAQITRLRLM